MNHLDHVEDLAPVVAINSGLDWRALPDHAKERIRAAVRDTKRLAGQTELEKIAGTVIDEWYTRQEGAREADRIAAHREVLTRPKIKK